LPAVSSDPGPRDCIGVLTYCSGFDIRRNAPCVPTHRGTLTFNPPPPPAHNQEWEDFAGRVSAAWTVFASSGYNLALRGANNHREYRAPSGVLAVLRNSGGAVVISGGLYSLATSFTADVSLHRTIPAAHQAGNIRSFIYHL
jgi:hypothetical protein